MVSILDLFNSIGSGVNSFISSNNALFGIYFIIFFFGIFSLVFAALAKPKLFKNDLKIRKVISFIIALISTIAIFKTIGNVKLFVDIFTNGVYLFILTIVLGFLAFYIISFSRLKGFKKNCGIKPFLISLGITVFVYGLNSPLINFAKSLSSPINSLLASVIILFDFWIQLSPLIFFLILIAIFMCASKAKNKDENGEEIIDTDRLKNLINDIKSSIVKINKSIKKRDSCLKFLNTNFSNKTWNIRNQNLGNPRNNTLQIINLRAEDIKMKTHLAKIKNNINLIQGEYSSYSFEDVKSEIKSSFGFNPEAQTGKEFDKHNKSIFSTAITENLKISNLIMTENSDGGFLFDLEKEIKEIDDYLRNPTHSSNEDFKKFLNLIVNNSLIFDKYLTELKSNIPMFEEINSKCIGYSVTSGEQTVEDFLGKYFALIELILQPGVNGIDINQHFFSVIKILLTVHTDTRAQAKFKYLINSYTKAPLNGIAPNALISLENFFRIADFSEFETRKLETPTSLMKMSTHKPLEFKLYQNFLNVEIKNFFNRTSVIGRIAPVIDIASPLTT